MVAGLNGQSLTLPHPSKSEDSAYAITREVDGQRPPLRTLHIAVAEFAPDPTLFPRSKSLDFSNHCLPTSGFQMRSFSATNISTPIVSPDDVICKRTTTLMHIWITHEQVSENVMKKQLPLLANWYVNFFLRLSWNRLAFYHSWDFKVESGCGNIHDLWHDEIEIWAVNC